MTTTTQLLKIGTRTSKLAMWQTDHIMARLQTIWPDLECRVEPFMTQGDKILDKALPQIGGKGLFTAELEAALRDGRIDIAVHSLKDLPVDDEPGLTLGAITSRAPVGDGLIAREGWTLETLPPGAIIGTSSNRRRAQLLAVRPDLDVRSIRGNVQTRARKVAEGDYHATVLAEAGIRRMEMDHLVTQWLPLDVMLPAPGQGALAVQCRADDTNTLALLAAIEDDGVRTAVTAERTFLNAMGGGCSAPIAAHGQIFQRKGAKDAEGAKISLEALVASTDGKQIIKVTGQGNNPVALGKQLASQATAQGADKILAELQSPISNLQSPLSNKRIVVTRSREQSQAFADKLANLGATPIIFPVIQFESLPTNELDAALQQIEQYDWILFTSGNAVDFFFKRLDDANLQSLISNLPQVAASGSATARKLSELGIEADFIPGEFVGEKLVEGLGDLTGKRVLLPRAKIGRPRIAELLRDQGAEVDDIGLYDTIMAVPTPESLADLQQGFDIITFTSPSSVRNFLKITSEKPIDSIVACIGPITRDQAQESGFTVHIMPEEYTIDGLIGAIVNYYKKEIRD